VVHRTTAEATGICGAIFNLTEGIKMKLKTVLSGAVLGAAMSSGAAFATGYILPTNGSPVTASVSSQTFSDTFGFTLSTVERFSGGAGSSAMDWSFSIFKGHVDPVNFSTMSLDKLTESSYIPVTGNMSDPWNSAGASWISFSASNPLTAGTYRLDVAGTSPSGSGSYGVAAVLTPVPEPETYAMMLAGLGLMGFIARRRKQR
jgi:hypothetical protein